MVTAPILVFLDWSKEFHVHVDVSSIFLGAVLAQTGEGYIDHLLAFSSRKLSTAEINYTTTEREGLSMVYALQKFHHYLLGGHFKMFTDHSAEIPSQQASFGGENMHMASSISRI
jgi:hypothetical protein